MISRSLFYVEKLRRLHALRAVVCLVLFALFVADGAWAAPFVNPNDCGGEGQPACHISAAKYHGKVLREDPGNGAFKDGLNGNWWNCDGWRRTLWAVTSDKACETGDIFSGVRTKSARKIGAIRNSKPSGAFEDVFRGEYWSCPEGFTRNSNPVHKGSACSATVGKACDGSLRAVRIPGMSLTDWNGGGHLCLEYGVCGKEGQRPCQVTERGNSCDKGLEEDFIKNQCRIGVFGDIDDLDRDFASFYQDTWEGRAIIDQVELSKDIPLAKATMIGSHNSYNSKSYDYLDPNQYLTILDQLKGGAHFIELDVHDRNKKDVVLCHSKHEKKGVIGGGCTQSDRKFSEGLDEIKVFLEDSNYENRIFIIYLENFSSKTGDIYDVIEEKIGKYVYPSGGCKAIPAETLTAKQIIDAEKRMLIWNGSEVEKECSDHQQFKNLVFTGLGISGRTWKDEPSISALASGGGKKWTPADVVKEIEAGKNLAAHDFLYINDVYKAMAWSWNANEPNNVGEEDCAVQISSGRLGAGHVWNDVPCTATGFAYACENHMGGWKVASSTGQWSEGEAQCQKLDPAGTYHFSVPATAEENVALTKVKATGSSVWLNYTDNEEEGTWVGKHRWNTPALTFTASLKASHSGKCLDGTGTTNGDNVLQWDCHGGDNQKATFIPVSGKTGVYSLKFKHSNRCLDVAENNKSNGANLRNWDCTDQTNQQFNIESVGDDLYKLIAVSSGRALDVINAGTANGANVQQYSYADVDQQKWLIFTQ